MTTLEEARNKAMAIVATATGAAGVTGWMPGSSLLLTAADIATITLVADAYGVTDFSVEQAIASAGKSFVGKRLAYELLRRCPARGGRSRVGSRRR